MKNNKEIKMETKTYAISRLCNPPCSKNNAVKMVMNEIFQKGRKNVEIIEILTGYVMIGNVKKTFATVSYKAATK